MKLKDAFKTFTLDQDKVMPPEETVRRFKEKLKALHMDILEKTERIDNGRLDIPVYFSICGPDAVALTGARKQMGKGATPEQAEASAVMELAERYSFFSFRGNPGNFFIETSANLAAAHEERVLPFDAIAKSVHDNTEDIEITHRIFEHLPMHWTRGFNLTQGKEVLVPFTWFFAINEFNGSSAGNCAEEAISQGICEVVERHVSSIVSQGRLRVPAIDPSSATDPMVIEMLGKYEKAGIRLYISDFSLDTGIPSIGILAHDPSTFPDLSEIVWTAGTTPDPQKALSRSLTEVAQLGGDFNTGSNYLASGLPKFKKIEDADFVMNPDKTVDITSLPDISHVNIKNEVENAVSALSGQNMDVIVIDTMHSGLAVPAFYTIIPGTHFRERALKTDVGMFAAKILTETHEPDTALSELKKIESMLPGKYYLKFYMGAVTLDAGNPDKALGYFEQAADLDPSGEDVASIYSYMGVCLKDMEKYDLALAALARGEEADQERTDIYNLMGFCHFKLKQHEEAIECFKKVLALDPGSAIDYANIASNYRDMGNREEAIRYYETALSLDASLEFAQESLLKLMDS